MSIVGRAFHGTDARLLVPVRVGGRIVMEVHDGWVEVLVLFDVHNRTSWTTLEWIFLDEKGKRMNVELQRPDVSGFPLASSTSFFAKLNQLRGHASIDM